MKSKPKIDVDHILADLRRVAKLVAIQLSDKNVTPQILLAPHAPPATLPPGKMAVYVFLWGSNCLKVGRAGPKSAARYTSQHYAPGSSRSNLARSLLEVKNELGLRHLNEANVGRWIRRHSDRINFLLDKKLGKRALALVETFLQCRLKPRFD